MLIFLSYLVHQVTLNQNPNLVCNKCLNCNLDGITFISKCIYCCDLVVCKCTVISRTVKYLYPVLVRFYQYPHNSELKSKSILAGQKKTKQNKKTPHYLNMLFKKEFAEVQH